jgi:transcriptional regulator with XRE-family HTH domain
MNNEEQKYLQSLANNIKARRNELKISQEKLADKCGFDRTYISLLERAKRNPSFLNLKKLSSGLDISLMDLFKDI